ncbi:MAG: Ig domain protein group 2 protein, partial [uncultured bacterium]
IQLSMPSGTLITADDTWTGTFILPTVQSNSVVGDVSDTGYTATVSGVIEVGYGDVKFTLSSAARLLIPGMGGQDAGYYRDNAFTKITTACSADVQATVDSQLAAGGDCKIDVDGDLVIWTKHFTKFFTYSQTLNVVASTPRSGGGGSANQVTAPAVATVLINNGAASTNNRSITLSLNSPDSIMMAITEVSDGDDASYEPYQKTKTFTLSAGNGLKTVYVKFRTSAGGTVIASDSITLTGSINVPSVPVDSSTIYPAPAETLPVVASFVFKKNLSLGSVNTDVKQLQMALKDLGFFTYPRFTTTFGPVTRDAVKAFQKANGITPVNGMFGPLTRAAMNKLAGGSVQAVAPAATPTPVVFTKFIFKKNLAPGNINTDVKQLQMVLKDLGFFTYPRFTTTFGPVTRDAVKAFQKANGITPVNGYAGPLTRAVLNSL